MLDEMRVNDIELTAAEIGALESADEVAHLFAKLGYNVDDRTTIPNIATLGLDSDDLRQQISRLELLAVDPVDEDIKIYLLEVRSVTAKLRNDIARRFRERPENALLVLTADYETFDFVLLERVVTKSKSRGKPFQQVIRPIPLNINRRNPEPVKLRVLKRFSFTEEDSAYQWEKLRSAYMLAEWSEEYFNNRALFSDYYLKERLTDTRLTPEWDENVRPVGIEAYKHIIKARKNFSRQSEATIRKGLYEPLFMLLGFDFAENKASDSAADEPDYLLYPKNDRSNPIAVALTYVWNRNLDDVDTTREPEDGAPDEIPGALVVSVLEKTQVPWVIVTNGKLWRLYSSTASNKATNYYEVDLEEAIAATDQITALKYWWLMFRQQAFTGFLDTLLTESDKYAKELGDRLKDDVFLKIFPQFAKGFISDMRAQGVSEADIDLDAVFAATMTFLYRMMFVLYAESLDLLPVSDEKGYGEYSLHNLKQELKRAGGENETDAPDLLRKRYTTKSTEKYERLKKLFTLIDRGDAEYNMPTYNGGLFSAENDSGQFLEHYAIPDQFLMLGLDRLTRDEDDKTKKLVFIDFKSLGVRQLGSIYEGLLEFKLKIAAEKLAVEKDGKREIYVPAKQIKQGKTKTSIVIAVNKDEPYLENDKQERRATGSYYTPDYIVKYIVQHTVGPVLERKLAEVEPRLRKAQKNYRDYAKLVEARRKSTGKDESPAVFWHSAEMMQLVDDCLNVRVLDPAMGSGHFLVEVVDFVSNKLITFLNAWSENPVWAALDRIREDILEDMDRQRVTIDRDKLTRVALLKRAVLKRCVYGVDLNLMAVELAKVSLWLDAFTLGAPLSFLDHHLKWGNSLIGARVKEVQEALEGQQTLFSQNKFAGVMLATDLMQKVSYLSDNTVAQVQASQTAYRDASDHLAPYKRVLDVYTSRWFGNAPSKPKRGGTVFDPTVEFLKRDDTQAWLEDPRNPKNRLPADDYMQAGRVAKTALEAAESKRFFHWELEFPEVFFAPSTPGGQDVQLRENSGFDAVVGNPPYERVQQLDRELATFAQRTYLAAVGSFDIYLLFMEMAIRTLPPDASFGFIVPNKFFTVDYGQPIREQLAKIGLKEIVNFGHHQVFSGEATTYTCIVISGSKGQDNLELITIDSRVWDSVDDKQRSSILQNSVVRPITSDALKLGGSWSFLRGDVSSFIDDTTVFPLNELDFDMARGSSTGADEIFQGEIIDNVDEKRVRFKFSSTNDVLLLPIEWVRFPINSGQINRYYFDSEAKTAMFFPYRVAEKSYELISEDELKRTSKDLYAYLITQKSILQRRANSQSWYSYSAPRSLNVHDMATAYVPLLANRGLFAPAPENREKYSVMASTGFSLTFGKDGDYDYRFLLALLNSTLLFAVLQEKSNTFRGGWVTCTKQYVSILPIYRIDFTTPADEREQLANAVLANYESDNHTAVLSRVQEVLRSNQTDVIHDVLAYLAQQMIELNERKQAEVKRFLGWLEDTLKIIPKADGSAGLDSLTGKTIIQNYLGDYQKGQPEVRWEDFYYRLHQNRGRFGVVLPLMETAILIKYSESLDELLPIKEQLTKTDALIDKIVYRLYGLTDAEIELIERPQYEQALADAKAEALKDETLTDEEAKINKIAEGILPAAQRFFERVDPSDVEAALDGELPQWRSLPPDAPTFLLTGDYNLRSLPDHMDFSSSVIPYTKAVEVALHRRIFEPFRNRYRDGDCRNEFLQKFMRGEKELTLGNYMIILNSRSEKTLRSFASGILADVDGLATILNDDAMREVRNKAAHDEVISRDEAGQARAWAFTILGMV